MIVTPAPAIGALALEVTMYLVAAPTAVVILPLVPVIELVSVAVTVCTVAAVALVVNVTVAMPLALVVLVALEKNPSVAPVPPVFVHVTTRPDVLTALLFASASCAVIVTFEPAVGVLPLEVTMYFVAAPAPVVMFALVPVSAFVSVAVTV